MKNLKKVLSLVLALAMALSLMTVAFAADANDFADYDKVEYNEAVDVLVAAGVFNGKDGNKFAPNDTLTREEAAKIITYMLLGQKEADKLTTTVAPYADVAAGRWSAGAIAYCTNEGILTGYNGKFNPTGKLDGLAFSKMLLTALGYDAKIEKLEGSSWAINAAKLAINNDLDDGMENVSLSKVLTREQAALMALNAMQTTMVYYAQPGTEITLSDGTTVVIGASAAAPITTSTDAATIADDGFVQFAERHCAKLAKTATTGDVFGRPANEWEFDGESVGTYTTKTPVATFNTAMEEKDIYTEIGASGISGKYAKYIVMDAIWVDGKKVAAAAGYTSAGTVAGVNDTVSYYAATADSEAAYKDSVIIAKGDESNAAGFGNGTVVEIYKTDKANHYTMVAINERISTVKSVTAANKTTDAKRYITINGAGNFETENFAKGDYVLYTIANGEVQSVSEPKVITGKLTKITDGSVYTIDGADYKVSQYNTTPTLSMATEGSWYVDSCGNIIANKAVDEVDVYYGYLLQYSASTGTSSDLLGNNGATKGEKFKFVDATGSVVIKDGAYKTNKDDEITNFVASTNGSNNNLSGLTTAWTNAKANVLFGYELNTKGEITKVYAAEEYHSNNATVTKGDPMFDGARGTDKTVYFLVNTTAKEYAAYTGYANVPTKTAQGGYDRMIAYGDINKLNAVAINVADVDAVSDKDYVYFAGTDKTEVLDENNDTVVTYTNVYVNGVKGSLKFDSAQTVNAGDVFEFTTNTKSELSTLGNKHVDGTNCAGNEITSLQSGYFTTGTTSAIYVYTDKDTVYYEIDKTNKTIAVVDGLPALSENDAFSVNLLYMDKGTDKDTAADVVFFYVGD